MASSEQTPAANSAPATNKTEIGSKSGRRPVIVAAVGGLLIVAAVALVLKKADIGFQSGNPAQPTVTFVAKSELGAAATTLTPSAAAALIDDAQRCKVPLVSMTISRGSAALGGTLRIRAGSYVSPYFVVTDTTQRVAMPYPAPYGSGAGVYIVEGTATGAIVGITPTQVMLELPGAQRIPVAWRPVSPC